MSFFRELPNLEYQSFLSSRKGSDDYSLVKNIFRRVKLRDDLQNVFTIFNKYEIQEGARPDTVAEELYGSSQYDWVVLIGANIINVRNEWPLSDRDIYRYSEELYVETYKSRITFLMLTSESKRLDRFSKKLLLAPKMKMKIMKPRSQQ